MPPKVQTRVVVKIFVEDHTGRRKLVQVCLTGRMRFMRLMIAFVVHTRLTPI